MQEILRNKNFIIFFNVCIFLVAWSSYLPISSNYTLDIFIESGIILSLVIQLILIKLFKVKISILVKILIIVNLFLGLIFLCNSIQISRQPMPWPMNFSI